jgi:hypothetical protein
MTGSAFYVFATAGAITCIDKLDAGVTAAISAGLTATLTVMYRIFVDIIAGTLTGGIAGVAPFVYGIKTGTAVTTAVGTALQFQVHNIRMGLRSIAVMTVCTAVIFYGTAADADATLSFFFVIFHGRLDRSFRFYRLLLRFLRLGRFGFCGFRFFRGQTAAIIRDCVRICRGGGSRRIHRLTGDSRFGGKRRLSRNGRNSGNASVVLADGRQCEFRIGRVCGNADLYRRVRCSLGWIRYGVFAA